jgi:hypothetical protein
MGVRLQDLRLSKGIEVQTGPSEPKQVPPPMRPSKGDAV